uniref:TraB family protein n=2 Tax=Pinguiococcus pyrenoidosus TaxID=172671 RepID=A0A7R9U140_9STRA|mmetsp:Transcript_10221/g.38740  ORF Transcript_10221/g.38740 Transcript_10221/m.38740 type:complete len:195 (+) Transcript_10221:352-936(+)
MSSSGSQGPLHQLQDAFDSFGELFRSVVPQEQQKRSQESKYDTWRDEFLGAYGLNPRMGMEFVAAIEEAEGLGAELIPFDRRQEDILTDLRNIEMQDIMTAGAKAMSKLAKDGGRSFFRSLGQAPPDMLDRDNVQGMVGVVDDVFPKLSDIIVHGRDRHMFENLRKLPACTTAVAVVGLGHLPGIEKLWNESES